MPDLPSGTVTYLFTDIQGSTPLWERLPEAMKSAIARYFAIVREAVAAHNGYVFKIIGDSFQIAFDTPLQAVEAAISAQHLLGAEPWGETGPLRARIGIHSGPGELIDEGTDYAVSHTLNRVARITSAGHGGQILISATLAELLHGELPAEVQLKDLGLHYLKGLSLPEHIFQVLAPGLEGDFPPLVSMSPSRHNLPAALTPFVGREEEVQEVCRLLKQPECRLVTLVGPGGIGKTRLALRAGEELIPTFPQGVWFAYLAGVKGNEALVSAIAEALRFRFYSDVHPRRQLLDYLREKRLLLILDNFEQLLDSAELLDDILVIAPEVKLLVTSREALDLREEWLFPLEGLEYPPVEKKPERSFETYSAAQLFIQTAQRFRSEYDFTQDEACITRLCQLLEGMPLAIELAAAWVKTLPCERILKEIENGLDILTAQQRNIPERQRSIRVVFEHAWSLLNDSECAVLERLSVFWGGFRLEAAEQVAGARLGDLRGLIDHSLLRLTEAGRYHIHELLRQYAGEILKKDPEAQTAVKARHSAYYLGFLANRQAGMQGNQQQAVLKQVDEDSDNIHAAWDWAVQKERIDLIESSFDGLYTYVWKRGRYLEGEKAFREAVDCVRRTGLEDDLLLTKLISRQGHFRYALGPYPDALKLLETSLLIARRLENNSEIAFNLAIQGAVSRELGNFDQAKQFFEESLALYRQMDDQTAIAYVLTQLGEALMLAGTTEQAIQYHLESLQISRKVGSPDRIAYALDQLGATYLFSHNPITAEKYYQEAMAIFTELNDPFGVAMALGGFGLCLSSQFNPDTNHDPEALDYFKQSLAMLREIGHRRQIGLHLWIMLFPLMMLKEYPRAKAIAKEGVEIGEDINDPIIFSYSLENLLVLTIDEQDFQGARTLLAKALALAKKWGYELGWVVTVWGYLVFKEGGDSIPEKIRGIELCSLGLSTMNSFNQTYSYRLYIESLEKELPANVFAKARERGKGLNLEAIIHEITAEVGRYA